MRILAFSDSHKRTELCCSLIEKIQGVDMVIHAGDHFADCEELSFIYPYIVFKGVSGNCDFSSAPDKLVFEAEGKRFFLAHGHQYNVKSDCEYARITNAAEEEEANIAIFGHTHNPYYKNNGRLILLNPGSITYSRTFGIIEIENGKLKADVCDASMWL